MSFTGFLIHIFPCQLHHESHLPVKRFRWFLTPVRKKSAFISSPAPNWSNRWINLIFKCNLWVWLLFSNSETIAMLVSYTCLLTFSSISSGIRKRGVAWFHLLLVTIYLFSYFIFNIRCLLFSIFFSVTRPGGSNPRADSSDDDTFSDSTEEEPCKVKKNLFLTAYKIACVAGVKRGRGKGNLGARNRMWCVCPSSLARGLAP